MSEIYAEEELAKANQEAADLYNYFHPDVAAVKERNARLIAALAAAQAWLNGGSEQRAKDYCMCGSPIEHSAFEGHSPVSEYEYALSKILEQISAALSENEK